MSERAYSAKARPHPEQDPNFLLRHTPASRLTHWAVALAYLLLFCSGLALFHPYFYWLSAIYGGGAFMAILHPYLGAALAVLFLAYASGIWRDNLLNGSDREWLLRLPAIMMKKAESPVEGKYNAGQKVMFWSMAACILALLASGVAIWRPTLAPAFSAPARRAANIVHAFVAFVMFVGIGVHAYAAFWTRGSIRSMTRGYVTRAWARFHHPGWYHAVTGDGERPAARRGGAP